MKKILTLSICMVCLLSGFSDGKTIDASLAKTVGRHFLDSRNPGSFFPRGAVLNLVFEEASDQKNSTPGGAPAAYFYVFNINETGGFILVAGDDIARPILAYSTGKPFSPSGIPPHVAAWLEYYRQEIRFAQESHESQTAAIAREWEQLISPGRPLPGMNSGTSVNPLLQTQWDQSPYYNDMCPYDYGYGEYTVTGCVATAMAQLMKYWDSPETGSGFHSYNSNKYGTLSADFGSTTYQWGSMPAMLSGPNSSVATLMHDCGISVDMDYGVGATGGSSAYVVASQSPVTNCAEYALKTYFGYNTSLQGLMRDDYSLNVWSDMLRAELDAGRPVLYAGIGSGGGHCFVCDGYDNSGYFHFNWGWSGMYDGYFQIDALDPEGVGTGGGTGGFNSSQQALFGVQPATGGGGGGQTYDMQLYASITPSSGTIAYGASFSVHTDIWNSGSNDFSGDFCAAVFDAGGTFIDYVEIMSGMDLPAGYHYINGLTFSNDGLLTMLPGTYTIGIYYRPTGGNWYLVAGGSYAGFIQVEVYNTNDIALYEQMSITPGTTLTRNQPVSVHLDVGNYGSSTFNGTFDVSLYDLSGYAVFTIQQYTGMSLMAGYHYSDGLTFSNDNLDLEPGTYLLAMQHKPNYGNWELTGSQNFPNPVMVTVQQGTIALDPYEPDNSVSAAYSLHLDFAGNTALVNTEGSNCHVGNDYDYYKINLVPKVHYTITARLHDSQNSGNGNTYSLDAVFSWSTNGVNWSDTYDDLMPNSFTVDMGGSVYFLVSPKYTGSTGTYLLDIQVSKGGIGIEENTARLFTLYPNPSREYLIIESNDAGCTPENIRMFTPDGKEVLNHQPAAGSKYLKISTEDLPDGAYYLTIQHDGGVITQMVIINH
jgi:hypothetical protein